MKQSTSRPRKRDKAPAPSETMWMLIHAADVLRERIEAALGEIGISMAKYGVLYKLAEAGKPATLKDLASHQGCVRSNITQLMDRLEADGLVRRSDDPDDRRSIRASLTALGREKQAAGAHAIAAVEAELAHLGKASDRAAVARVLSSLT